MRGEFVDIGGHRLYYYARGTRGSGDPIVLIHGFPTSGHLWNNLTALLPPGRRIVVPDLLGHGRSDHPAHADLSLAGHASRLRRLLDELGVSRAALVGHHAGALIAGLAAIAEPERFTHLAMLNPIAGDAVLSGTLAVLRAFLPIARLVPPGMLQARIHREISRWYNDPSRARVSVDMYLRTLAAPNRWPSFMRQLRALETSESMECTRALATLNKPVAIVAGSDDPAVPATAVAQLRRVLPRATLDIFQNDRHFSPEESPEQVARVVTLLLRS